MLLCSALGVTKLEILETNVGDMFWSHFDVIHKSDLVVLKPTSEAGLLTTISCLAPVLGVTKFIDVNDMILVTL
jgi:hypothetical protein